jgi:hypothetical protein
MATCATAGPALAASVLLDRIDLALQIGDPGTDPPAVHLEFGLAGPPRADAAAKS